MITTTVESSTGIHVSSPETGTIDARQLRALVADDPMIRVLDVRSGAEFESAHITGSYNIPLDTLREHADDLADIDHPIVLVCASGARAGQAHDRLVGAGKQRLRLLDGGLDAWLASGGEVVRGSSDTWAMDRQVRFAAGTISLVGIVGSVLVPQAKWLAGAVAAGLAVSAVTNTCAMGNALAKLPYNQGRGCDVDAVVRQMRGGA